MDEYEKAKKAMNDLLNKVKAEGREQLTAAEDVEMNRLYTTALEAKAAVERGRKANELIASLTGGGDDVHDGAGNPYTKTYTGLHGGYAHSVVKTLSNAAAGLGTKALLTGQVDTPPAVEVAELPKTPQTLLDLIPKVPQSNGNTFSYLRQVTRTNNAAVVPDNATKPTSIYTFQEVEDRCRVVAHLSEPFPLRYLSDHETLTRVLDTEMVAGVKAALEAEVLAGDGTGEHFTGLLHTTGVRQVPYTTDAVTTIRKAVTAAQTLGALPTGWVFSAQDAEALDLLREDGATGGFLLGGDTIDRLLKVPAVVSTALPAGTALLGNWSSIRVRVREDAATLAATQAGDLFDKNQVKLRAEGRFGLEILQPSMFAVVDLTA